MVPPRACTTMYDSEFDDLLAAPALASRESRLFAVLANMALVLAPMVLMIPFVATDNDTLVGVGGLLMGGGWIFLLVYQIWLLSTQGQSLGKQWQKIRIVRYDDGSNPGFVGAVVMRGFVPWLIGAVPVLGGVFALANPLFIFARDRRCLHDHLAGTIVVDAHPVASDGWHSSHGDDGQGLTAPSPVAPPPAVGAARRPTDPNPADMGITAHLRAERASRAADGDRASRPPSDMLDEFDDLLGGDRDHTPTA